MLKSPRNHFRGEYHFLLPTPAVFVVCGRFCGRWEAFLLAFPSSQNRGIIFCAFFSVMFVEKLHTYIFNFYQCLNLPAALLSSSRPAQRGSFRNRRPGRTSLLVGRLCLKKRRKLIYNSPRKKQNLCHYFNSTKFLGLNTSLT